jgi:hypothetical protein
MNNLFLRFTLFVRGFIHKYLYYSKSRDVFDEDDEQTDFINDEDLAVLENTSFTDV